MTVAGVRLIKRRKCGNIHKVKRTLFRYVFIESMQAIAFFCMNNFKVFCPFRLRSSGQIYRI
jgi:hypothetical protein